MTLVIVIFTVPVTASAHAGHLFPGGFSSASALTYQIENAKGTSGIYGTAAREWAKQSTKVSIYAAAQHVPAKLYLRDAVNGSKGSYGLMLPYYRNSSGNYVIDYDGNKTWAHAYTYMYMNNMSGFSHGKYMFVALHEMGHALSLKHNNVVGVSTVMRSNMGVLNHTTPTSSDKSHLQLK